jgi:hypothetical protein
MLYNGTRPDIKKADKWPSGNSFAVSLETCLQFDCLYDIFARFASAGVAQLVEHLICNQRVGGSTPSAS